MAAAEQPLKKRKLYDPPPPSSPPPPQPPPPPEHLQPPTPPPLSQEEILRRRRAQEEIRNVFELYKKLKSCVDHKDKRSKPEIEDAYLSLVTASGGGASVQRLVAEYLPRYAAHCPTALEAAAKSIINMHNRCFTVISREEDIDGIAFDTAKSCILGLVDICHTAALEAPTSAVIQGICSAVFLDVLTFFVSSFEGKDIFDVVEQRVSTIYEAAESFSDFKREFLEEDNSVLLKLSKLRALSFLRIFFSCPKNTLVACFELLESAGVEGIEKGNYLLRQLTIELNDAGAHHVSEGCNDELSICSSRTKCDEKHPTDSFPVAKGNSFSNISPAILKNCLLGLVLGKDPSFKSLVFLRYRMLCDSSSPEVVSNVTSVLDGIFESFVQQVKAEHSQVDGRDDTPGSSKNPSLSLVTRMCNQQGSPAVSPRDCHDKLSGIHFKKSSRAMNVHIDPFDGESKSMDLHYADPGDQSNARPFLPRELLNRQSFSPRAKTPRDFRSNSFNGRNHSAQVERSPIPNMDLPSPVLRSASSPFESPRHNIPAPHSSTNHAIWYSDGDPAAMDVYPASKQLWLGSLGPDASEMLIRHQFEKFGPIDQLRCFPFKGFATIEYRNIMDALKAREVMRGRSPWGACLRIKFLDAGLGTRGAINGTAVGSSCHVYVGNVSSIWAKDEVMHEVKKVLHKSPRMVIDLNSECALLMEFDTPEEATVLIAHLRWHRKENSNFLPPNSNIGPANVMMHAESNPAKRHHVNPPLVRPDNCSLELTSPRISQEHCGPVMQTTHSFPSTWTGGGYVEVERTGATEQSWMYGKPESGMQTPGPSITPPQHVQAPPFIQPAYAPQTSLWDARHHVPPSPIPSAVMTTNVHANLQGPPFLPASVTPLAQIQGSSRAPFDQMFSRPVMPPRLSSLPPPPSNVPPPLPPQCEFQPPLPPHSELQPPLPPTPPPPPPPPPPHSQPPAYPPPPSSPPPPLPPPSVAADAGSSRPFQIYPWQGILSKSGVYYCTINAQRVDSDLCKYSNAVAEPAEWPAKLDMTKRTDLRHVRSTFSSTPSHRREICWLLPTSPGDHKGFQDFISYLKQRDCAGVIKIPASKSMWARLLFILPYLPETCSMLSIPPNPSLCLIGLVLPKETNSELA